MNRIKKLNFNNFHKFYTKKNPTIGIRKEDKNVWERRTPLSPRHVKQLVEEGVTVYVEPSQIRCFSDKEYVKAGAILSKNLEETDTIFAVKEVPPNLLQENKTYAFFSHTIKAQAKNMEMLDTILKKNIRLIDYERFKDNQGKRIVRSGPFAGMAGTIDGLHILGERLLMEYGLSNPFTYLSYSRNYPDLNTARNAVRNVGDMIEQYGLPKELSPLTFTITGGNGSVASGAKQILELLPHKYVQPHELESFWANKEFLSDHCIYIIITGTKDYVRPKDPSMKFDKVHYYNNPKLYEPIFHETIMPYTKVLINGMYWDWRLPRLCTNEQAKELISQNRFPLLLLEDITSDERGSFEFFAKTTPISDPAYVVNIEKNKLYDSTILGPGVLVLGCDHLPAEFPVIASEYFGDSLLPFVKNIAESDINVPFEEQDLNPIVKDAVIAANGKLTPSHQYIFQLREEYEQGGKNKILLLGSGSVAPPIIDYIMRFDDYRLTVASADLTRAVQLTNPHGGKATPILLDAKDDASLSKLIKSHDVILSLLPPPFHPKIARLCIEHKKNLITASYISPEMKSLDEQAKQAGVLLLNELGLDPGIDHMGVMKMLEEIELKNGKVISFKSFCGAIPEPKATNNPLGYKFSWSPAGVISASQASANFLYKGENVVIPGDMLMGVSRPVNLTPGFNFRMIPNRDSMKYRAFYGLDKHPLKTMIRGTIRYPGFSNIFMTFQAIGLFKDEIFNTTNNVIQIGWDEFICKVSDLKLLKDGVFQKQLLMRNLLEKIVQLIIIKRNNAQVLSNYVFSSFGKLSDFEIREMAKDAIIGMKKLEMLSSKVINIQPNTTIKDIVCQHLIEKLSYEKGEQDLVFMYHEMIVEYENDPVKKIHTSSLALYGDNKYTATALTVGYPVAIGAHLLLQGKFHGLNGVLGPNDSKQIWEPVLHILEKEGVKLHEETSELIEFN